MRVFKWTAALALLAGLASAQSTPWSAQKAKDWYAKQPWLVGANYLPANAINQLEMWQAATWDPKTIDQELGWAQAIGMNTMRVFLHDLAWKQDPAGFKKRIDEFLAISARHRIRPLIVFFDSCWDPSPKIGPQRAPTPGIHNSGWVQSPGKQLLASDAAIPELEKYVKDVVKTFRSDERILGWDVWNEPDNDNKSSYGKVELINKTERVAKLLPLIFQWVRSENPTQPVTSGVWAGTAWSSDANLSPIQKTQLHQSDIISFHNYEDAAKFEARVKELERFGRPLLCTEYLARGVGSTFSAILPVAKKYKVAAINWGLVAGKSQTNLPWDSWQKPYVGREPAVWHHEVFKTGGAPYKADEVNLIRSMTSAAK